MSRKSAAPPVRPPHRMRTAAEYYALGQAEQAAGRLKEASGFYQKALAREPGNLQMCNQIGVAFQQVGEQEKAAESYRHIVRHAPQVPEASACLGNVLREMGAMEEAAECFRRAIALRADHPAFHNSLAVTLREMGQVEAAIAEYRQVLALQPGLADVRWNLALLQLLEGDYAEGWRNYETRWQRPNAPRSYAKPLWRGEALQGARILLHSEQGLGDNLQFLRYVPMVEAAGGVVILDLPPAQHGLAAELVGARNVVLRAGEETTFDWHCPLMSLPLAFGTTVKTIPSTVPYLRVPQEARARAEAIAWPQQGLRVGLVWSGNAQNPRDRFRSMQLAQLTPLLEMADVHFYSLQAGPGATQRQNWSERVMDLSPMTDDMSGLAACMEKMDVVLTVDTLAAHLAGALALSVWLLLSFAPDWRWMRNREDSPWYSTMRVFRQPALGDWDAVILRVREELKALLAGGHRDNVRK